MVHQQYPSGPGSKLCGEAKPPSPLQGESGAARWDLDVEFENGQIGRRTPRAHCKLPKSAMGARAGLEKLGKVAYDAKRDRGTGMMEIWLSSGPGQEVRGAGRRARARQQSKPQSDDDSDSDAEDQEDDGYRQNDAGATDFQKRFARQGGVGGAQMKTTVRNLRIREDTAKYLRNLDPESAFTTRSRGRCARIRRRTWATRRISSTRATILPERRATLSNWPKPSCFAWDERRGTKAGGDVVHTQADPSRTELARRDFEKKRKEADAQKQRDRGALRLGRGVGRARGTSFKGRARHVRAMSSTAPTGGSLKAPVAARQSRYAEDVHESGTTASGGPTFAPPRFDGGMPMIILRRAIPTRRARPDGARTTPRSRA